MRRVVPVLLAAVLALTGCAGDPSSVDEGAAREVLEDSSSSGLVGEVSNASVALRLAVAPDWSLDPADAGAASITNRVLSDLLYEGLTSLDADGVPQPALAQRWFVSDDRLTWTFELPDTLTDGQGNPLTARDVKSSLERVAARGVADQAATSLTAIVGWSDRMTGAAADVAGISADDETTVVIRLETQYELLLEVLASPALGIALETEAGWRTTGAFRTTGDPAVLESVDPGAQVNRVDLVINDEGPAAALAAGLADWAVLSNDDASAGLPADIVRQPLDLEVAIIARAPSEDERRALLGSLEPLLLATSVEGLTARPAVSVPTGESAPEGAIIDVPVGELADLGTTAGTQLEAAGIQALVAESSPAEFAERVASGDAQLFPIVSAGGTGPASAVLRLGVPGASDDVFGPESEARDELATAVVSELDVEQRQLFADALERVLIEEGLLLPIGQFEVRIALGDRLDGLRHRADGTLDLSDVRLASS